MIVVAPSSKNMLAGGGTQEAGARSQEPGARSCSSVKLCARGVAILRSHPLCVDNRTHQDSILAIRRVRRPCRPPFPSPFRLRVVRDLLCDSSGTVVSCRLPVVCGKGLGDSPGSPTCRRLSRPRFIFVSFATFCAIRPEQLCQLPVPVVCGGGLGDLPRSPTFPTAFPVPVSSSRPSVRFVRNSCQLPVASRLRRRIGRFAAFADLPTPSRPRFVFVSFANFCATRSLQHERPAPRAIGQRFRLKY
jgi:hypothetical protein